MKDNFEQWLNENSITEVECLVPDLGGIARGKILPTNKFIKVFKNDGDIIFFLGHITPGIYSRSFLEGRISENMLKRFRLFISVDAWGKEAEYIRNGLDFEILWYNNTGIG